MSHTMRVKMAPVQHARHRQRSAGCCSRQRSNSNCDVRAKDTCPASDSEIEVVKPTEVAEVVVAQETGVPATEVAGVDVE